VSGVRVPFHWHRSIQQTPGLTFVCQRAAEQVIKKERARGFDRRLSQRRQKAREYDGLPTCSTLKQGHERNRKGLGSLERFQGAVATDGVAEEDGEKTEHQL
jgi:hypothetical protein